MLHYDCANTGKWRDREISRTTKTQVHKRGLIPVPVYKGENRLPRGRHLIKSHPANPHSCAENPVNESLSPSVSLSLNSPLSNVYTHENTQVPRYTGPGNRWKKAWSRALLDGVRGKRALVMQPLLQDKMPGIHGANSIATWDYVEGIVRNAGTHTQTPLPCYCTFTASCVWHSIDYYFIEKSRKIILLYG